MRRIVGRRNANGAMGRCCVDTHNAVQCLGPFVLCVVLACGPNREQPVCYDVVDRTDFDPEPGEIWVCDQLAPISKESPEFDDWWTVAIELPPDDDGNCAMCAEDLDPLFWDAFLEVVEVSGLAMDEDPGCVHEGYAIELACRIDDGSDGTCKYEAYVASNCTIGPHYTP